MAQEARSEDTTPTPDAVQTPRYPAELAVTVDDFRGSGWKDAISETERHGYTALWSVLSKAAKAAMENGDQTSGKVLWLLADACSAMLKPTNVAEPFYPMFVMPDGRRSVLPDDLTGEDLVFLASIVDEIDEPWLQARIADILWVCVAPKNPQHALNAIDAYRSIPIEKDVWVGDGRDCWTRAAVLAGLLKDGAGDRRKEIAEALWAVCIGTTKDDGYLTLWIADLLVEHRLLLKDQVAPLAQHLETLGTGFKGAGDHYRCRDFLNRAIDLNERIQETDKAADLRVLLAESWVTEAEANPSGMVSASHFESAIQTYRQIPRKHRSSRKVDERMAELRAKLSDAGERALDEMGTITSEGVDISDMVERARSAVRGKEPLDALGKFAALYRIREQSVREAATKSIKDHPISHLFPATVMSGDGRVIAKSPGAGLTGTGEDQNQVAIWAEMVKLYGILTQIVDPTRS